ncbi:hypothetical protein [Burkholderia multivorans]|uniref:hypothetical protein n=1 Tax=Burkholderia multivorans TaxID=87883 RepID=UPI0011B29300|nr:hypothetical protein [Burkholderia multivorans]
MRRFYTPRTSFEVVAPPPLSPKRTNFSRLLQIPIAIALALANGICHNALNAAPSPRHATEDEVNLDYLSEEFVMAVLMAAIDRHYKLGGKNLHEIVMGAIQICIDADRAIENYVKRSECSCRTLQDRSRDL